MKPTQLFMLITLSAMIPLTQAQNKQANNGNRYNNVPVGGVLSSGPLPDLNAFTPEGKPLKLRELCKEKYTVLSAGCLTCPMFHRNYPVIEAAYADYADKGVQFFYFYKSLRHPELNGYVQAQNMSERLLQLKEARRTLGTKVPWIADTIDDSMRIGLRSGSFSVFLTSPDGEIIHADAKISEKSLRDALVKAVGPVSKPTSVNNLNLPKLRRQAQPVNQDSDLGVARPKGLAILSITPAKPEETYYVKLRAEADDALLNTGTGRLFLGFYPDPIHHAHWNNLTPPMKYKLTLPKGVTATPAEATAKKGPNDSDIQPRQFWVDVKSDSPIEEMQLQLNYFGCTPDLCLALTHEYTIRFEFENRGASTYGLNRGPGGNGRTQGNNNRSSSRGNRSVQMDTDTNGTISFEEICAYEKELRGSNYNEEQTRRRFDSIDSDKDGIISLEELNNAPRGRGRR